MLHLYQFLKKRVKTILERQLQRKKEEEEKEFEKDKLVRERQSKENKWERVDGEDKNRGIHHGWYDRVNGKKG
jgi:Na+-translocating ferredoxin:NAD+ oxidoreductase RnfC subunit